jgi:hypothetical protein
MRTAFFEPFANLCDYRLSCVVAGACDFVNNNDNPDFKINIYFSISILQNVINNSIEPVDNDTNVKSMKFTRTQHKIA